MEASGSQATDEDDPACKLRKSAMEDLLDDFFPAETQTRTTNVAQTIQREIDMYKTQPTTPLSSDPLVWWSDNAAKFPYIAAVARLHLGIPATSVPSDRVFSTAGDVVTAQRSRLSGEHVDQLIFSQEEPRLTAISLSQL